MVSMGMQFGFAGTKANEYGCQSVKKQRKQWKKYEDRRRILPCQCAADYKEQPQRRRSDVSHEYFGGRPVPDQKSQTRAGEHEPKPSGKMTGCKAKQKNPVDESLRRHHTIDTVHKVDDVDRRSGPEDPPRKPHDVHDARDWRDLVN